MPESEVGEVLVGKITHFFDQIMVAAILLEKPLKVGDTIHIKGRDADFNQEVASMQIDRKDIIEAKAGDEVGMRVNEAVREKDEVYQVG